MTGSRRKKVLIITYYWPPSGGSGVQRWLKFTKYMRDYDYEPVIYTAENPEYPVLDESLSKEIPASLTILKTRIWEPYQLYKWFTRQKKGHRVNTAFLNKDRKQGWADKVSVWIRSNFFIPDARKFWVRPSVKYLARYLKHHPVDLVVSTGPPHSMHLIAMKLVKRVNIPWVADFRDPWTTIHYYRKLMLSKRADRKHHELERKVLQAPTAITVVNQEMKQQFSEKGAHSIRVIHNGYDPDDFAAEDAGHKHDTHFSLTHIGALTPSRNPDMLWEVLAKMTELDSGFADDLLIQLIGSVDYSVMQSIRRNKLEHHVVITDYLEHNKVATALTSSKLLLLLVPNTGNARGILTGKLFEYLCSGRPILAIGPEDGEANAILKNTAAGTMVGFDDHEKLEQVIRGYHELFRKGSLEVNTRNIEAYSRRNLTKNMTRLFNEILEKE